MSFLAPLFFAGLAALAVPVLVHLIQRERKQPIEFPSLMFVRRIPYQSVQRRRIHNWLLFALRAAAIILTVLAFTRPFFMQDAVQAAAATSGARDIVILLDRSASMGYADRWQRAQAEAKKVIDGLGGQDRATLVLFDRSAEEHVRATGDRTRLAAAVEAAKVGSGATRYSPALRLAQSLLTRSPIGRKHVVVISDMQRTGWERKEEVSFPEGTEFTPISVATPGTVNIAVTSVTFGRARFSSEERVTVTAGLTNRADRAAENVPASLDVDGQRINAQRVTLAANASTSVTFPPFTLSQAFVRGVVRAGEDPMPADNAFNFVLSPGRPVKVMVVAADGGRADQQLYLSTVLALGNPPAFESEIVAATRVTSAQLDKTSVVILNDLKVPSTLGALLTPFVERGGGIFAVVGGESNAIDSAGALFPGKLAEAKDGTGGRAETLGVLDFSHPIFELFKTPRSGDFSSVRFFRYRPIEPGPADKVLARFADGTVAMTERRVGTGRVIAFASTFDGTWNDLVLRSVFVPLVHESIRHLSHYEEPAAWQTTGQVMDVSQRVALLEAGAKSSSAVVLTPSGQRRTVTAGEAAQAAQGAPPRASTSLPLEEQGFYEIRPQGASAARPFTVAVNLDPAESNLGAMDLIEFAASATGKALAAGPGVTDDVKPADTERRQSIWWYLLLLGFLALVTESVLANRLSQKNKASIVVRHAS